MLSATNLLKANHGTTSVPWFTVAVSLRLVVVMLLFGGAADALIFDREAIAGGELWRLFTAHLTHIDMTHLAWNLGAFVIMGWILETQFKLPFLDHAGLLMTAGLGINAWLWFGEPGLQYYAGLSAILNAQFIVLVAFVWTETQHPLALLAGFGGAAKVIVEILFSTSLLTSPTWPPLPEAHGVGMIMGIVWLWMNRRKFDGHAHGGSISRR